MYTGGSERMRIDSSGNLLVGKTSTAFGTEGFVYEAGAAVEVTTDSNRVMRLNRTTNDGNIIELNKDGTTVGSIGTNSGLFIGSTYGNDAGIRFASDIIAPATTTGANRDAAIDLGYSSGRFKDLYLSGGVYLGGTVAANKLDDYEEGTWTPAVNTGAISGTSITYTGKYVKVGDMVTFTFVANSASGDIQVSSYVSFSGLPFTLSNFATSTVVTEDIDVFSRQGFAIAYANLSLSACGSSSGTNNLFVSITGKISA
jgi:hypothetical protein